MRVNIKGRDQDREGRRLERLSPFGTSLQRMLLNPMLTRMGRRRMKSGAGPYRTIYNTGPSVAEPHQRRL